MFFRPDDSKPLAPDEDDEWFEMERMGRWRYIARRTASVLGNTIIPVAALVWAAWWLIPSTREFLLGRFTWIGLAIGTLIVGPLAAAHAWDTWRSYERRAGIEETERGRIADTLDRAVRFEFLSAILATVVTAFEVFGHARWWLVGFYGTGTLLFWRSAHGSWVLRRNVRANLMRPSIEPRAE